MVPLMNFLLFFSHWLYSFSIFLSFPVEEGSYKGKNHPLFESGSDKEGIPYVLSS